MADQTPTRPGRQHVRSVGEVLDGLRKREARRDALLEMGRWVLVLFMVFGGAIVSVATLAPGGSVDAARLASAQAFGAWIFVAGLAPLLALELVVIVLSWSVQRG